MPDVISKRREAERLGVDFFVGQLRQPAVHVFFGQRKRMEPRARDRRDVGEGAAQPGFYSFGHAYR